MLSVWMVVKVKTAKNMKRVTRCKILGSLELPNGEIKHELVDLTVEDFDRLNHSKIRLLASHVVLWLSVVMLFFMFAKAGNQLLAEQM